jgi:hypothetical protein
MNAKSSVIARCALALLIATALLGCVPPAYRSEGRIMALSKPGTMPLRVTRTAFAPESDLDRLGQEVVLPENFGGDKDGGELLRDLVITDATIDATIKRDGIPDAVELHSTLLFRYFTLYYADSHRSLLFQQSLSDQDPSLNYPRHHSRPMISLDEVPRSVYRIALHEGPLPPPWPQTIPFGLRAAFGVPTIGAPTPDTVDGKAWNQLAQKLSSEMQPGPAYSTSRAQERFSRLARANPVPGLEWKLIAFDSSVVTGFGVPSGTIFVSTALIERLNDSELTAVMAHLMGHERYQHYVENVDAAETMRLSRGPGYAIPEVPNFPEVLTQPPYAYTRWQEIEANRVAVGYLAKVDIPPDALFDALLKLSSGSGLSNGAWPIFSKVHNLPLNAFDLGRLLDANAVSPE